MKISKEQRRLGLLGLTAAYLVARHLVDKEVITSHSTIAYRMNFLFFDVVQQGQYVPGASMHWRRTKIYKVDEDGSVTFVE